MSTLPTLYYTDRSDRGRLKLTGRDRQTFLQGMVTNDIVSLTPGQGTYAFMLDATGHILADMTVLCREDCLLLDTESGMAPFIAQTLDKYLIMERVKITDVTAETAQIGIGGPDAVTLLETLVVPTAGEWREGTNHPIALGDSVNFPGFVAATTWNGGTGFDLYVDASDKDTLLNYLKAEPLDATIADGLRIEGGIPRFGVDIDSRVLAPETGQQRRAINYRKGCYIGQEIVARIDARGHTNRELAGFWLAEGPLPERDTPVVIDDREVGRITSAALGPTLGRPIALGYIRHEHRTPGTRVLIAGQEATVAALPFALQEA